MGRFRPLKRIEARLVAGHFLNEAQSQSDLTEQQQAGLDFLDSNSQGSFRHMVNAIVDSSASSHPMAAGLREAVLAPVPGPGKAHPILDWLRNGGLQWLWTIAQEMLQFFFHIPLPPIPPPPVPPKPPAPAAVEDSSASPAPAALDPAPATAA